VTPTIIILCIVIFLLGLIFVGGGGRGNPR